MPAKNLDRIFHPRSVALVGVSADAHKLNGAPLGILRTTAFPGRIYPVNPKYEAIDGLRCYARIDDLPEAPDVAMLMLPAREVPDALESCGRKGTRAAVVISSGFEEIGADALVRRVKQVCRAHDIALVGPNCEGVWSVRSRALLTFGSAAKRDRLTHSPVAIVSQSGAMAGAVARHLQDSGFGCAYLVSVGNETVLGLLDYVEYLLEQDDVRVVLMFLEGLGDGPRLLAIAEKARERGIVLVALKAGNSAVGRDAVASHTGKIATTYDVYRDVLEQAGVIAVAGLVELVEAAEVFSTLPLPARSGRMHGGLAVYSIPGGTRALTADLCEQRGVPLAAFEAQTVAALESKLPAFGYARNPTDVTGVILSAPQLFNETLGIVAHDPNTEALLIQLANRGPADAARYGDAIHKVAESSGVPTVISFLGDALPDSERRAFARAGVMCARDPGDAVRYFSWLFRARELRQRPRRVSPPSVQARPSAAGVDWAASMRLLADAGIGVPRWALLGPGTSAEKACAALQFPVALKALPEDAAHKTERGLVRLNLHGARELEEAAKELRSRLGRPDATLLVQEMVAGGVESVLSARRDADFGAVLSLGSGGVLIELARDVGHVSLPADRHDVDRLIGRLRLDSLLRGYRGAPPGDREALIDSALRLGQMFASSALAELEINPLIVLPSGQGVVAVDVLVKPLHAN